MDVDRFVVLYRNESCSLVDLHHSQTEFFPRWQCCQWRVALADTEGSSDLLRNEARDARFAPVEVFAGKGELCMGAAAIFFSGCVSFNSKATWQGSPWNTAGRNNSGFRWTLSVGYGKIIASVPNKGGQWKMAISKAIPHRKKCQKPPSVI